MQILTVCEPLMDFIQLHYFVETVGTFVRILTSLGVFACSLRAAFSLIEDGRKVE